MITFTLRIFLMGLVAVAPSSDEKNATMVVLRDMTAQGQHAHFPVLVWSSRNRVSIDPPSASDAAAIRTNLRLRADTPQLEGFLLNREEVSLTGAVPGGLDFRRNLERSWFSGFWGRLPEDRTEAQDMSWVPEMADVSEGARIGQRFLQRPDANGVASLMALRGIAGRVRAFSLATVCGKAPSLTFRKLAKRFPIRTFRQASADVVVIEITVQAATVTFTAAEFALPRTPRTVTLRPAAGEGGVDVLLGNLTPLNSFKDIEVSRERAFELGLSFDAQGALVEPVVVPNMDDLNCDQDASDHFMHYYDLLEHCVPLQERRIPHMGLRSVRAADVEPAVFPQVIRDVSGTLQAELRKDRDKEIVILSGETRPICTVATASQ